MNIPEFLLLSGTDKDSAYQIAAESKALNQLAESLQAMIVAGKANVTLHVEFSSDGTQMTHFKFLLKRPHKLFRQVDFVVSQSGVEWSYHVDGISLAIKASAPLLNDFCASLRRVAASGGDRHFTAEVSPPPHGEEIRKWSRENAIYFF